MGRPVRVPEGKRRVSDRSLSDRSAAETRGTTQERRFAVLKRPRRVWAVASIHGEAGLLARLHRELLARWQPFDRIVYLGNMIGRGQAVKETLDSLLTFRRQVLAVPHAIVEDVVYLRGGQEEMWQKLLQLQFATDPRAVLKWMLDHGAGTTLEAYGGRPGDGLNEARHGPLAITRWTSGLRQAMQKHPGHFQVLAELRRAAYSDDHALLFVNAGLDPSRPLEAQADSFWWGHPAFAALSQPYGDFCQIVRGFDPRRPGLERGPVVLSLDGGAGFGGPLLAACLGPGGALLDRVEVAP